MPLDVFFQVDGLLLYGRKSVFLLLIALLEGDVYYLVVTQKNNRKRKTCKREDVCGLNCKMKLERDEFFVLWKFAACATQVSHLISLHLISEGMLGA